MKEYYKKEISLENFVIENVTTEFFETRERRVEAIVHVSDLEWAIVLRNVIRNAGDEEKLAGLEKVSFRCVSGKILYLHGKTRYAGRDSKKPG